MPKRRIRPRLRRLLRAPVRCRDKAILSSGHARKMLAAVWSEIPAFRPRACAVIMARCRPAAPDLVRRLARLAQVPLAVNNARKIPDTRRTWARMRCLPLASGHARGAERCGSRFPRGHDRDRLLRGGAGYVRRQAVGQHLWIARQNALFRVVYGSYGEFYTPTVFFSSTETESRGPGRPSAAATPATPAEGARRCSFPPSRAGLTQPQGIPGHPAPGQASARLGHLARVVAGGRGRCREHLR